MLCDTKCLGQLARGQSPSQPRPALAPAHAPQASGVQWELLSVTGTKTAPLPCRWTTPSSRRRPGPP